MHYSAGRVGLHVLCAATFLGIGTAWGKPAAPAHGVGQAPSVPAGNVPQDWWSRAQKSIAASEYNVTWQEESSIPGLGAAWQAPNRAQNLRTYFTTAGPRVVRRAGDAAGWTWGLELVSVGGLGDAVSATPVRDTCTEGNRITFERDGLAEWYVNSASGLEQGFTIYQAPASGDTLVVRMGVRGDLSADMVADGQTVEFLSPGGVGVMHYGKLRATDASGRELSAVMTLENRTDLELRVDTAGAAFPVTIDPLATSAACTAESDQANAYFGWSAATAGDVNGDGYSDVIIGSPTYDNGQTDEGRAFVHYGSATGLSDKPDWTAESNQAGAYFGWSVATAGDVNGDGYSDVIVSALYYDNGQTNEGRVYVYHGSASGLSITANWTAESNQANSDFGVSVSTAGDVNGDGFSDVIVGADAYDNGQTDEGRAFVYYGSAGGLAASAGWTAESNQAGASFGASVGTAGDVDGDGYADVIIGAPYYDNTLADEGRVYVYSGSASGLGGTPLRTIDGGQASAYFGCSVSTAGDVNGDGYADVIVGAYGYDNGETDEGRAYVYFGSSKGTAATAAWTAESNQAGANFGWSVATAGDVNGDGYADVIVSAPTYDNGQTDEGRVYVYYGSSSGPSAVASWTAESDQVGAKFGYAVFTAGDVNGDGFADVVVGAPFYDNGETDEGRAFVYYGSASTLSAAANWTAESNQANARFGYSVASAGDVNGDGYADVIVGAQRFDNGQTEEGAAFVYHGSASGLSATANWQATGGASGAWFGQSVATAGDVNGDGYSDVIIGANGTRGKVYAYYGSASGLSLTADWTKESDGSGVQFGFSLSSAGDVNGDGYADVIIGDYLYTDGQSQEGAAFVFNGSASGLSSAYSWRVEGNQAVAKLGWSVSTAGDVNGDGYSDVVVGATGYDHTLTDEGAVFIYYGSASGPSASPSWSAYGGVANTIYGESVSAAGDVNGDGYADVIVGASHFKVSGSQMGRVDVWYGSPTGPQASPWSVYGDQAGDRFGVSVSTAGDVNGDGYADVIVGAPGYSNGQSGEGKAFVYHGSASGLSATPAWAAESNQADAQFGYSVSTAGDVNGDGYADVIVGAPYYDSGETDEGLAVLYYGNGEAGRGLNLNPRQRRGDDSVEVAPMGLMPKDSARLAAKGRTPFGRGKAKLECELKPYQTAFNGTGTVKTASWTSTGVAGAPFNQLISGLANGTYHWRMRLLYSPAITPFQQRSRWFAMPWDGWGKGDFRLVYQPPAPPTNPGSTAIGASTITWTWTDNSYDETGFKVWSDPGSAAPTTLRTTTASGVTSYPQGSLTASTQYAFQVAATGSGGDSAKTNVFSSWTLANTPTAPTLNGPTTTSLSVSTGTGDGNSATTEYAIRCTTTNAWVQANGALGASAVYRTASAWGAIAVTGLVFDTYYTFAVTARNGAGTVTAEGPGVSAFTLTIVPNVVGMVEENAQSALDDAGLAVGQVMEVYSSSVPSGTVLLQGINAGSVEPVGTAVNITVSLGPAPVNVPNVVGMTESAAGTALANVNLTTGAVTQQCSNTVAAGLVISQTPTANQIIPHGSAVALVVSTGPCPVTVPNVVGLSQSAAGTALTAAHLTTGTVTEQYSATVAAGLVISQNPTANSEAIYNSAVNLVVSKGAAPPMTGSIIINNNRSATNNPLVTLSLTWAGGDGTGVVRMRFSNDGSTWTAWESLAVTKTWTLPSGDGHKTVRVQYIDKLNNKSAIFSDYIRLDQTPPTGTIIINDGAATTTTQSVTLKLTWSDSGAQVSRMRFSDDGAHWTAWMPQTATRAYTLPAGLGYHTVRVQYLDGANNYSVVYNDYIKLVAP